MNKSIIYTDQIVGRQQVGSEEALTIADNVVMDIPGSMVQYKQTVFQGQFTNSTASAYAQVSGLDCTIQPRLSDSLILCQWQIHARLQYYQWDMQLRKDGSDINDAKGNPSGSRLGTTSMYNNYAGSATAFGYRMNKIGGMYLDTPGTTNDITYQIWLRGYNNSYPVYVNRSHRFLDNSGLYDDCPISTLSLWEFRPD